MLELLLLVDDLEYPDVPVREAAQHAYADVEPYGPPDVTGGTSSADNEDPADRGGDHDVTAQPGTEDGGDDRAPVGQGEGPEPSSIPEHWLELARCESGNWIDGGASFSGPIRWDWGAPGMTIPPWGTTLHHGGLQFAPSTWEWVAGDLGLLGQYPHAYDAPPAVQVQVATEVQARQGWQAWPVCSRKVGLR